MASRRRSPRRAQGQGPFALWTSGREGAVADPILKTYATQAVRHFEQAAVSLAFRQVRSGAYRGNVASWPGATDSSFHGTLGAIWVWARHQVLSGQDRFAGNRRDAWAFVEDVWRQFIPEAIGPEASSDEAAYDCAMVLRAALGERGAEGERESAGTGTGTGIGTHVPARATLVAGAARVLAAYLADLDDLSGRDFQDPGFAAWNLIDYARSVEDRGLLSAGRRFVERSFGMKAPPPFIAEPETPGRLFDFSSTTATRVLAIMSSEGNTPFVGAWLRERVAGAIPRGWSPRARDENCWNGCVAAVLGRAYVVSTDPVFLEAYRTITSELSRRDALSRGASSSGGLGRSGAGQGEEISAEVWPAPDSLATFYYALAIDALVRSEADIHDLGRAAERASERGHGR
jgi:hypothetical protein